MGYVVPFDRRVLMDIFVPPGQEGGASPGEMVIVELTRWPTATRGAIGRVAEVLGDIDAPGVDTEIIIRKYGIPDAHPDEAVAEALRLGRHGLRAGHPRAHRFPFRADRDDRRRARPRFRRRDHDREAPERATSGSACTSPTSRTTCRRAARWIAKLTSAERRCIFRSAPCTCFRPSSRPGSAA